MGLAVMACCDAMTAMDMGRSGRTPVSRATSAITGSTEYATWPVPAHKVNRYVMIGAMNVMRLGFLLSAFSARWTR